jgi:8-oxo-dGTP pyrophosphatase MutT (NUDIX family)
MEREFSAGGVAVRRMRGGWWLAAIVPRGKPRVLALPKGLVEQGEATAETAVRETLEETGLRTEHVAKLGDIRYVYTRRGVRVFKVVSFHQLRVLGGRLGEIDEAMRLEVEGTRWLPLGEYRQLSYSGEREVAGRALDRLTGSV